VDGTRLDAPRHADGLHDDEQASDGRPTRCPVPCTVLGRRRGCCDTRLALSDPSARPVSPIRSSHEGERAAQESAVWNIPEPPVRAPESRSAMNDPHGTSRQPRREAFSAIELRSVQLR
jgi:hypothetical protein